MRLNNIRFEIVPFPWYFSFLIYFFSSLQKYLSSPFIHNGPRLGYCEILLHKYDVKLLNHYANHLSVIPLIEYMHIYHLRFLAAIRLGLYIKHSDSGHVCGRVWNMILGGNVRLRKTHQFVSICIKTLARFSGLVWVIGQNEENALTQNLRRNHANVRRAVDWALFTAQQEKSHNMIITNGVKRVKAELCRLKKPNI